MTSSGVEAVGDPGREVVVRGSRWAGIMGAAGAAAMAVGLVAMATFWSVPGSVRVVCTVLAVLVAVLALGLWHRSPAAIAFGMVLGAFVVLVGVEEVLAAGDNVYEQYPHASDLWTVALLLVLGAWVLVAATASVPPAGRVGRWVALFAVVAGLGLMGAGARWLLEVHPLGAVPSGGANSVPTTGVSTCGSAFDPGPANLATACWEQLVDARDDGRLALAIGAAVALAGAGLVLGQFGRRAWPAVSAGGGALTIGLAVWLRAMPLQSTYCTASYEQFDGAVCDGLRSARSVVWLLFVVVGAGLVVAGVVGAVVLASERHRDAGEGPQVSA